MSLIENKLKSSVQQQAQEESSVALDHRLLLIRCMRKYPSLYKNEFLRTPFLHRHEKHEMWNKIAQESGFEKTGDAKCKWRSLTNYLRQHLDNVAKKKTRRYIPTTDNPEDKYVQLNDWSFYRELEFIVPYVKYATSKQGNIARHRMEISPTEIDLIIEGIVEEVDKKNEQEKKVSSQNDLKKVEKDEGTIVKDRHLIVDDTDYLAADDEILKEYFENMLKSTLKLPRFHQNRVKQKLLNCVNEQKAFNKIN